MGYFSRRLLQVIPTLVIVALASFLLISILPGDPVYILAGGLGGDPQYFALLRAKLGLNVPLTTRLINYMLRLISGDLGVSTSFHQPVIVLIGQRLPSSLLLGVPAVIFSSVVGIALGVLSAVRENSWQDNIIVVLSLLGYSIPLFWLGQLLITAFGLHLGWLPSGGIRDAALHDQSAPRAALDVARHLVLPAFSLGVYQLALVTRITRAGMVQALKQDYVHVARAKGLSAARIWFKHALPNTILAVITVIGTNFAFLFAGIVVIESVFSWPGMGRLVFEAVLSRDYPLIIGVFVVSSIGVVLANITTDLLYLRLDPRIQYE